jgi:hypothetical protein
MVDRFAMQAIFARVTAPAEQKHSAEFFGRPTMFLN